MTRGNQRELARQKAAKKQNEQSKGKRNEDGLSAAARKQRDAEIMQQKQKKANEAGKAAQKSKWKMTRKKNLNHRVENITCSAFSPDIYKNGFVSFV